MQMKIVPTLLQIPISKCKQEISLAGLYRCTELVKLDYKFLSSVSTPCQHHLYHPPPHHQHHGHDCHHHHHHHHCNHHHKHLFTSELVEIILLTDHHILSFDLHPIVPGCDQFYCYSYCYSYCYFHR